MYAPQSFLLIKKRRKTYASEHIKSLRRNLQENMEGKNMKINKKEVVTLVIDALLGYCCLALFSCAIEPTFNVVYNATKWMPSCIIFVFFMAAIALVVVAIMVPFIFLMGVVEIVFSDDSQGELVGQLEASNDEAESRENVVIVSNHGDNLKEVMEAIRCEAWEYSAVFDLSGRKLAEGTYQSPTVCNISEEDWRKLDTKREEVVRIHNHPAPYDGSFSEQDFYNFLFRDYIRKYIVVTRKYNFVLEKTVDSYSSLAREAMDYAERLFKKYLRLSHLSYLAWTVLVSRKTAKRFDLKFRVERVSRATAGRKRFQIGLATCAITALCLALTGSNITTEDYSLPSPSETVVSTTVYFDYSIYDDTHSCKGIIDEPLVD